jgi:hypothetical protein
MQVVYPRCCGLDIHKKSIVACVLLTDSDGTLHRGVAHLWDDDDRSIKAG